MNYEEFLDYAKKQIKMSNELATSFEERDSLLRHDQLWLEGFANGLAQAGAITKDECESAPVDISSMIKE